MTEQPIFKLMRQEEWQQTAACTHFSGSADDKRDGFIHFSAGDQVIATAEKYFSDCETLHVLAIDAGKLPADALKWEASRGGALFPHLYAPMPLSAVARHDIVKREDDGWHQLYEIEGIV